MLKNSLEISFGVYRGFTKILLILQGHHSQLLSFTPSSVLRALQMFCFKKSLGWDLDPRPLPYQGNALARLSYQGILL